MSNSEPTYKQMSSTFHEWFSTGYLPSMKLKLALISLVGWIVYELRKKKPDITYYQLVHKLAETSGLDEFEIKKIAIICEDFAYNCKDFETFGLSLKEAVNKVKEILGKILPF